VEEWTVITFLTYKDLKLVAFSMQYSYSALSKTYACDWCTTHKNKHSEQSSPHPHTDQSCEH